MPNDHPESIRAIGHEFTSDQIGRRALPCVLPCRDDEPATPAYAQDAFAAHQPCHPFAVHSHALIDEFGPYPRHAVGAIGVRVDSTDPFDQEGILQHSSVRRSVTPVVVAAGRHIEYPTQRSHQNRGLIRVHEFVDPMNVLSPLPAN